MINSALADNTKEQKDLEDRSIPVYLFTAPSGRDDEN